MRLVSLSLLDAPAESRHRGAGGPRNARQCSRTSRVRSISCFGRRARQPLTIVGDWPPGEGTVPDRLHLLVGTFDGQDMGSSGSVNVYEPHMMLRIVPCTTSKSQTSALQATGLVNHRDVEGGRLRRHAPPTHILTACALQTRLGGDRHSATLQQPEDTRGSRLCASLRKPLCQLTPREGSAPRSPGRATQNSARYSPARVAPEHRDP